MAASGDEYLGEVLRPILDDLAIGDSFVDGQKFREVASCLEYFIPDVLSEVHAEWEYESLDGVLPVVARKTAELEAEILGHCILISDQTVTPFHLRLQLSPASREVSWLECRFGKRGKHGMERMPYDSRFKDAAALYSMRETRHLIDWVYHVGYGSRRD